MYQHCDSHCKYKTMISSRISTKPLPELMIIYQYTLGNISERNFYKHTADCNCNVIKHFVINSLWPSDAIWRQQILVNPGSGNGLLPDGTKPLPEPMLTTIKSLI